MKFCPNDKQEPGVELASIYSYLLKYKCWDTVLRLMLGFALKEVAGANYETSLLAKIEQQLQGQEACPTPYCWLRPTDEEVISKHEEAFKSLHYDQTILAHVFEAIVNQNYGGAVGLISHGLSVSAKKNMGH